MAAFLSEAAFAIKWTIVCVATRPHFQLLSSVDWQPLLIDSTAKHAQFVVMLRSQHTSALTPAAAEH